MEWQKGAFKGISLSFNIVFGYGFEKINYNKADNYYFNFEWEKAGNISSLFCVPLDKKFYYVCYGDVIVRNSIIKNIEKETSDIVVAIDSNWKIRYERRTKQDLVQAEKVLCKDGYILDISNELEISESHAEYAGIAKFSPKAIEFFKKIYTKQKEHLYKCNIPKLISIAIKNNFSVKFVDVYGDWAELNAPQDLAKFILGTKAETISRLYGMLSKSLIPKHLFFSHFMIKNNLNEIIDKIIFSFGKKDSLAIRSSALNEDSWEQSNAGAAISILNVPLDRDNLKSALIEVVESYDYINFDNQVLVQKMVTDIKVSGVIFTRTLSYGSPYYIINYDDSSELTDTVTSGSTNDLKTFTVFREKVEEVKNNNLKRLLFAVQEIENLIGHDYLDIEFVIDSSSNINILQVRPIAVKNPSWSGTDENLEESLCQAQAYFQKEKNNPYLLGDNPIYGVMPDWNPAEIISTKPKYLSKSIYSYLVTDGIWAKQRSEFGYRDLYPLPLMQSFAGHPYIDVRASLNSFIPKDIDESLAEKLVNYYIKKLSNNIYLHDKIEFEVAITCVDFCINDRLEELSNNGFSKEELIILNQSLAKITQNAFSILKSEMTKVFELNKCFNKVNDSKITELDKAFLFLDDCKVYGTLPFAHIARCAFVAVSFLKSAVKKKLLTLEEMSNYLASIDSVTNDYKNDLDKLSRDPNFYQDFINKYGHLRPGTYEVSEPNYSQRESFFLNINTNKNNILYKTKNYSLSQETIDKLELEINKLGLNCDFDEFDYFLRESIKGREHLKFEFTKNLSFALEELVKFGEKYNISRDEISHIKLSDFDAVRKGYILESLSSYLKDSYKKGKLYYDLIERVELPPLILSESDLYQFFNMDNQANFIGNEKVSGEIYKLDSNLEDFSILEGKIVLISQADPGYDWLFGYKIKGLITAYGGANSHMAIRAAEFKLPAVIGIGDDKYKSLSKGKIVILDCAQRKLELID